MLWNASVLSTTSSDTEPTIIITFDSAKYIFNVGENTTRAFLQSWQNWKKTRALFLTSTGTQRASGLPGFFMTLADAGQTHMQVTGPSGLFHLIASMRKYTYRDNLVIAPNEVPLVPLTTEHDDRPVYEDGNISVFALPVVPSDTSMCARENVAASTSKRRRDDSPESPSKRPSTRRTADPPLPTDPLAITAFLRRAASASDFEPTSLRGEVAQAWRQLIIQSMFPASQGPSEAVDQGDVGSWKAKRRSVDPGVDAASTFSRIPILPKFSRPLPVPERSLVGTRNPICKPTVAYAVVGPRIRGKFDGKKALELGLPPGPLRARLIKGERVTVQVRMDNGDVVDREIKPEDCIGESVTPAVVLFFDTPTLAHIAPLISGFDRSGHFARYLWKHAKDSKQQRVKAIFHLCEDSVLEDERYKTFMDAFGPEVHHIVASRRYLPDPITFTSAAYSQLRLHQLDPNIFPIQKYTSAPEREISSVPGLPANVTAMQKGLVVHLHPPRPPRPDPDATKGDLFHPAVSSNTPLVLPESTRSSFADARSRVAHGTHAADICGGHVRICPLGTNSAMPSKYRNVSATLVQIPGHSDILLDCGEGTWGQLVRKFGDAPGGVWQTLRRLKCIFISHMHGDHHIGLAKLLAMRQRLDPPSDTPLYVVGNDYVFVYLHELAALEDLGFGPDAPNPVLPISVDVIHWKHDLSSSMLGESARSAILAHRDMCTSLGLESFRSVDVTHRTRCHGAIITHADGWKIVYSGDTVPTHTLVQAGENATLLIHEATMADDQAEMAAAKMHSTVGQAIDIGKRMKARHILLTHFSARYPNVPPQSAVTERTPGDPVVALAFDHADIRIDDMWKMHTYTNAIEQSFTDLEDEHETTAMGEVDLP